MGNLLGAARRAVERLFHQLNQKLPPDVVAEIFFPTLHPYNHVRIGCRIPLIGIVKKGQLSRVTHMLVAWGVTAIITNSRFGQCLTLSYVVESDGDRAVDVKKATSELARWIYKEFGGLPSVVQGVRAARELKQRLAIA